MAQSVNSNWKSFVEASRSTVAAKPEPGLSLLQFRKWRSPSRRGVEAEGAQPSRTRQRQRSEERRQDYTTNVTKFASNNAFREQTILVHQCRIAVDGCGHIERRFECSLTNFRA
ncbi:MAG: hypothetical protein DWI00_13165 [Planctomycetota bacterium]|nr:MAG: hypothetical protein DWI00_13165 [Planctomycetota bacterium]